MGIKTQAIVDAPSGEGFPGASSFQTTLNIPISSSADLDIPIPVGISVVHQITVTLMGRDQAGYVVVSGAKRYQIIRNMFGGLSAPSVGAAGVDSGLISGPISFSPLGFPDPDTARLTISNGSSLQITLNILISRSSFVPGYPLGS